LLISKYRYKFVTNQNDHMEQTTHPILFQPEMVQAILEGQKTQTRRAIKGLSLDFYANVEKFCKGEAVNASELTHDDMAMDELLDKCPYGKIGDLLWVRETCQILGQWVKNGLTDTGKQRWTFVIHPSEQVRYFGSFEPSPKDRTELGFYTRPAIHCPSWTSRITLEITDIRAERMQSISGFDAMAEGIAIKGEEKYENYTHGGWVSSPISSYFTLWDKINGSDAHKINPWVWAVTFKRIKP
jgi:hypothetical protein